MFGFSFVETLGIIISLIAIFSSVAGGIIWLLNIATKKGKEQADGIKEDIQEIGREFTQSLSNVTSLLSQNMESISRELSLKIDNNEQNSKERGENFNTRLEEHNKNMMGHMNELKAQQNRQLDFIKTVNEDCKDVKTTVSKVSNRVSKIEGILKVSSS